MEEPVYVLSPHLDDGVLSCGQLLANRPGSTVITVFAGAPHRMVRTPYDKGCGFATSLRAVLARRAEDANACGALGVRFAHLGLLDAQYRDQPADVYTIARAYNDTPGDVDVDVFAPLGLCHPDHFAVSDAAVLAGFRRLWFYEDLPYRVQVPESVPARLDQLADQGVKVEYTTRIVGDVTVKRSVARCYASQLHDKGDLGVEHCWLVPERYWRVVR